MTRDRADLQRWYREAMRRRVGELHDLRPRLASGDRSAFDAARSIGMSLRGSGATFGFPHVSELAMLLEIAPNADVLRRVEGLAAELRHFAKEPGAEAPEPGDGAGSWLLRAAGLAPDADVVAPDGDPADEDTWAAVARAAGTDAGGLAAEVAAYFGLDVADLARRSRAALRLVPEALVASGRVVPLNEDARFITVATANPTSLSTELELEQLTGRRPSFVVAPPGVISALIDEIYGGAGSAGASERREVQSSEADRDDPASVPAPEPGAPASRPRVRQEPAPRRSSRRSPGEPDGAILVVDDEPSVRLLLRSILEKRGYRVVEAEDGVSALDALEEPSVFRLVVADLNMPRMDGLELIWALRDGRAPEHLPVIVVTGETDEILETQLLEEGADDYIRKPIDPRLFLARVEATARRCEGAGEAMATGPASG